MKNKPDILDWLNIKDQFDYSKNRWLGTTIGAVGFLLGIAIVGIGVISVTLLFGSLIGIGPFSGEATAAAVRNLGLLVAAVFSAPFLVWRTIIAQRQAEIAEQSQITDRINKAVEGLGAIKNIREQRKRTSGKLAYEKDLENKPDLSKPIFQELSVPNIEVRVGAIYALERIAQDSPRDHIQIMEILCAYIRGNAKVDSLTPSKPPFDRAVPRVDIQTSVTVIGRRSTTQLEIEKDKKFRLDLSSTDLSGVTFNGGNFSAALFIGCRIEAAQFLECDLTATCFDRSLMNFCNLYSAQLVGTRFSKVVFSESRFSVFNPNNARGVIVSDANFRSSYLSEKIQKNIFGTNESSFNFKTQPNWDEIENLEHALHDAKETRDPDAIEKAKMEFESIPFSHWSPFPQTDGAYFEYEKKYLESMNLTGWPHDQS